MSTIPSNDPYKEAELVEKATHGDHQAFRELVEKHRVRVFRFLSQHAVTPAEAEELAQEVFAAAHRSLPNFKGNAKFSTWLTGIALNVVRNFINRNPERKIERSMEDLTNPSSALRYKDDSEMTPSRITARNMKIEELRGAIDALPVELRETFVLVVLDDLDYEQVAKKLGVPVGTVKSRVSRARARIRTALGDTMSLPER